MWALSFQYWHLILCFPAVMDPYPSGIISANKLPSTSCLVIMLYCNRTVTTIHVLSTTVQQKIVSLPWKPYHPCLYICPSYWPLRIASIRPLLVAFPPWECYQHIPFLHRLPSITRNTHFPFLHVFMAHSSSLLLINETYPIGQIDHIHLARARQVQVLVTINK